VIALNKDGLGAAKRKPMLSGEQQELHMGLKREQNHESRREQMRGTA
jgi:hypothetical protein